MPDPKRPPSAPGRPAALLALALLPALLGPAPGARAAPGDAACARDVIVSRSTMRMALDRLDATGDDEAARCRAWREHVATMRRAAAVFGRCLAGAERERDLGVAEGQAREFDGLVRARCR